MNLIRKSDMSCASPPIPHDTYFDQLDPYSDSSNNAERISASKPLPGLLPPVPRACLRPDPFIKAAKGPWPSNPALAASDEKETKWKGESNDEGDEDVVKGEKR